MNWTWATLDEIWRAPSFPEWAPSVAGIFFALLLLVALLRAERSVANGALTIIALLAIGGALALSAQRFNAPTVDARLPLPASLPALSCLDGLAGDAVETACEKALFASAEASAAAVSYTAAQITRLVNFGEDLAEGKANTELSALRRALERDRFGLVAHVLAVRDGCTPADCGFYVYLSDRNQIATNMTDRAYQELITHYASVWGAVPNSAVPVTAALPPSVPSGKPVSGDFPSSSSIPAVSIMTPEPSSSPPAAPAPKPLSPPSTTASTGPRAPQAAAKKAAPPKNAVVPGRALPLAPPS